MEMTEKHFIVDVLFMGIPAALAFCWFAHKASRKENRETLRESGFLLAGVVVMVGWVLFSYFFLRSVGFVDKVERAGTATLPHPKASPSPSRESSSRSPFSP